MIETETAWSGLFGNNQSNGLIFYTFGQSFTVPLSGDTVFLNGRFNVNTLQSRTITKGIAPFNTGTNSIGTPLGSASVFVNGNGFWQQPTFSTAGIPLTPGGTYALYMRVGLTPTSYQIGYLNGNPYSGGRYLVGPNFPGSVQVGTVEDAAFRIELGPVPEPATMTALAVGALALLRKRRS